MNQIKCTFSIIHSHTKWRFVALDDNISVERPSVCLAYRNKLFLQGYTIFKTSKYQIWNDVKFTLPDWYHNFVYLDKSPKKAGDAYYSHKERIIF